MVEKINASSQKEAIYDYLYSQILLCNRLICEERMEEVKEQYIAMVKQTEQLLG